MDISIADLQALEVNVLSRWGTLYCIDAFSGFFMDVVSTVFRGKAFLQMAIRYHVSKQALIDIIEHFDRCTLLKDRFGKLPIEVATGQHIKWDAGLEDIVEATFINDVHSRSRLVIACSYGVKWDNGLENIVAKHKSELCEIDATSGLYPALLVTGHEEGDVNSVFQLLRLYPSICITKNSFRVKRNRSESSLQINS
jgi:hypothetical protein